MKRDFEIFRQVLLEAELSEVAIGREYADKDPAMLKALALADGHFDHCADLTNAVRYNLGLMEQAGLVSVQHMGSSTFVGLTYQGHDFLDSVRDEGIWGKAKAGAASVGGVTFGLLKDIAVAYLKQKASESLGIAF